MRQQEHSPGPLTAADAPRPRPDLAELPEYRAGRPPIAVPGLVPLKLSSNERSDGPAPARRRQLLEGLDLHRYPDPLTTALRAALSARLGIPAGQLVTESGSLGALRLLLDVIVDRPGGADRAEVVYPWRSFEAYPILVAVAGARGVPVPLTEEGANDLDAMADAVGPATRAVVLCSPNNPTGEVVTARDVERFLRRIPRHVLVVIDEAYAEYVDDDEALNGMAAFRRHPNVAVLRTFSKAHGLAGLRIGYAVAAPDIAEAMWRVRPTFAVTALAEHAALLALDDEEGLARHVAEVRRGRTALEEALRDAGASPTRSQANFVWFEPADPAAFEEAAARAAFSVRRLGDGIRITVGDDAATARVLDTIAGLR